MSISGCNHKKTKTTEQEGEQMSEERRWRWYPPTSSIHYNDATAKKAVQEVFRKVEDPNSILCINCQALLRNKKIFSSLSDNTIPHHHCPSSLENHQWFISLQMIGGYKDASASNADMESSSVIEHPLNLHCEHSTSTSEECSNNNDILSPNNKCGCPNNAAARPFMACRSVTKLLVPHSTLLNNVSASLPTIMMFRKRWLF